MLRCPEVARPFLWLLLPLQITNARSRNAEPRFGKDRLLFKHLSHFFRALSELFLKFANQLVIFAFGVGEIVIGQLSVLLFKLTLDLIPGSFELEFVHISNIRQWVSTLFYHFVWSRTGIDPARQRSIWLKYRLRFLSKRAHSMS